MFHHRQIEVGADGRMGAGYGPGKASPRPWPERRERERHGQRRQEREGLRGRQRHGAPLRALLVSPKGFRRIGRYFGPGRRSRRRHPEQAKILFDTDKAGDLRVMTQEMKDIAEGASGARQEPCPGRRPPTRAPRADPCPSPRPCRRWPRQWPWRALTGDSFDARGFPTLEVAWRPSTPDGGHRLAAARAQRGTAGLGGPRRPFTPQRGRQGAGPAVGPSDGCAPSSRSAGRPGHLQGQRKALQTYGTPNDLNDVGIRAEALANIPLASPAQRARHRQRRGPERPDGSAVRDAAAEGLDRQAAPIVARIAAYHLRSAEGYQPSKEEENALRQRYLDAKADLEMVKTHDLIGHRPLTRG